MFSAMKRHEEEIDRLYGLPLERFTAARDELARSLRADGQRADADAVTRLRKPNLIAWALNQVRREDPRRVEELLAAGERLQDAQHRLVGGGERGLLRRAAAEERELVEELAALGERRLSGAGHTVSATLQTKLRATVHAAAAVSEAREKLQAGRLVHDYEISDLGLPSTAASGVPVPPSPAAPSERAPVVRPPRRSSPGAGAERKRQAARSRLERAREQVTERETTLAQAERRVSEARREAERATAALARAEADVERARAKLGESEARVAELQEALVSLSDAG
jgi:hypothetical protein